MIQKIEKLIEKLNAMEGNMFQVERNFFLGSKMWVVGKTSLKVNGEKTNEEEQEEFIKLKEEFDKY